LVVVATTWLPWEIAQLRIFGSGYLDPHAADAHAALRTEPATDDS
jgi:hypothetical protein